MTLMTARDYLERAESARNISRKMTDAHCRRALEKIATNWEDMAAQAVRMACAGIETRSEGAAA